MKIIQQELIYPTCIFFIICFFTITSVTVNGQSLGLPFSYHISPAEYGAGMLNTEIDQGSRGFMYFANNFGLIEFDGSEWNVLSVKQGSKVRSLKVSSSNIIYVAAQGEFGYFQQAPKGDLEYISLSKDLPKEHKQFDEAWKVFIGSHEIYFCTFNKVFVYLKNKLIDVVDVPTSENFFFINNRLYAQTNTEGVQQLLNGKFNRIVELQMSPDEELVSILGGQENKALFISNFAKVYNPSGTLKIDLNSSLSSSSNIQVNTAIVLRNGHWAIGTQQSGLFITKENGELDYHITKNKGLESRTVTSIMEDIYGNLWLSHDSGISVVELSNPFTYINEDLDLPGSGYDAYIKDEKLFLATNYGLYNSDLNNSILEFKEVPNTSGKAYTINEINDNLVIGHHNGGYFIKDNAAKPLESDIGMWKVIQPPDNSELLIAGTYTGLKLFRMDNDRKPIFVSDIDGFNESSRVMEFDDLGYLWMTHGYKGVFRLKLTPAYDKIVDTKYYGIESGLPLNELVNVYKIENELIFTAIDGIYRYDYSNESFFKDTIDYNIPELNQPLNVLGSDSNNLLYFLGQSEMGTVSKSQSDQIKTDVNTFNKVFTLLNDDLPNMSILNSNNICYGGKSGFVIFNPHAANTENTNHDSFIRRVSLTGYDSLLSIDNCHDAHPPGSAIDYSNRVELDYQFNSIEFEYTSNFLNDYKRTNYQYILEGFDVNWTDWATSNEVRYTNLNEGEYTFKVRGKNIYNTVSNTTEYHFKILPPWYRSAAAYAGYATVLLGSFLFGFIFMDSRYRKSKEKFQLKKQLEVDEIGDKLETLSIATSEEINQLKSEKLEAEVERKTTELGASTMNLINKNKFITHIKDNLHSITKKSKSEEVQKELSVIMKEIDKNISHDDDWQQFTFHFNNVHGDFTQRLTGEFENLSSQDIRLCSYLRLNLTTKEIADLLNISVRGVEISRYRLRKKLMLERSQNLAEFILNY